MYKLPTCAPLNISLRKDKQIFVSSTNSTIKGSPTPSMICGKIKCICFVALNPMCFKECTFNEGIP
jgi:hypothetical protein